MANKYINNYILISINTVANLVLPIITFPYISRVIGAEYLGMINFVNSYGYYFMHFASFGISSYAIREVSRLRDNREELEKVAKEIYSLNLLFSVISGFVYFSGVIIVPKFHENIILFALYSITIFTNFLSLEWLFQAFDDYKFTTIRSIAIRILSIVAVFIFVKEQSDYHIYMLILTISDMGNRFSNLYYARKKYVKVQFRKRFLNFAAHIRKMFTLFIFRLINGISANLDKLMIGFMLVYSDVGIYSAGVKFVLLIIPLIENIGIVLFPKINISAGKSSDEYKRNLEVNYNLILMLSIPMAIGLFLLSPIVINLFAGSEFQGSILVSRIMCFIIVLCPIGDMLGSKILLVYNKDSWLLICSSIVAVSNIVLNAIFITLWKVPGAAIASVLSYFIANLCRFLFSRKLIKFRLLTKNFFKYILFSVPFVVIYILFNEIVNKNIIFTLIFIFIAICIYAFELFITKDRGFMFVLNHFFSRKVR